MSKPNLKVDTKQADLDARNMLLFMGSKKWTIHELAEKLGCSPATARNSIRHMRDNCETYGTWVCESNYKYWLTTDAQAIAQHVNKNSLYSWARTKRTVKALNLALDNTISGTPDRQLVLDEMCAMLAEKAFATIGNPPPQTVTI